MRLIRVLDFIDECGFHSKSRAWRKSDLFTFIIEINFAFSEEIIGLDPLYIVGKVQKYYDRINEFEVNEASVTGIYYKATLQASNDRINRVRRGEITGGISRGVPEDEIKIGLLDANL